MAATIAPTYVETPLDGRNFKLVRWANINDGDTCTPAPVGHFSDKTVAFLKGAAFGGNMLIRGSPDPTAAAGYVTLTDPQGNAISGKATDTIETIEEGCYLIQPVAGAGVAGVTCYVLCQSAR